jgi:catechol 2,3-dioxygenase-like lactoylglutathione lyase family enzyme
MTTMEEAVTSERVSAVQFAGRARAHMGLEVADLERSIEFYRALFAAEPTKLRPGYARFEPGEPSLHLSLNQGRGAGQRAVSGHFGVQVQSTRAVEAAEARLTAAGHATRFERDESCCYALQDKVWAEDPDGNAWEIFCTLRDDDPRRSSSSSTCCAPVSGGDGGSCCTGS